MNNDRGHGSPASGFFIFISPAPVVGERASGEEFGIVRRRLVGEQHHDFAADVDALVVVPLILRRGDAMAHEHGIGLEFGQRFLLVSYANEVVEPAKGDLVAAGGCSRELGRRLRVDAGQGEFLKVSAVIAGRLGSQQRELRGDVLGGEFAAARADASAFEQIAGQKLHVSADAGACDLVDLGGRGDRGDDE